MKTIFSLIVAAIICLPAFSQEDDTTKVKLDLLRAPSSPGANLLGFATSDIEKPSDVSSFMASLQSAAGNNSIFPSNYAVDLAPFWLFRGKGLTTDKMDSKKFGDVFRQTFVFSTAVRGADSTSQEFNPANLYNSFGIKFAIRRGSFSRQTKETLDTITLLSGEIATHIDTTLRRMRDTSTDYLALKAARAKLLSEGVPPDDARIKAISKKMEELTEDYRNAILEKNEQMKSRLVLLKQKAQSFKIERFGFFIDFAGGVSLEFVDKLFSHSNVHNGGAWLTFGGNYESGFSILGLGRYLYNPGKIFADDAGTIQATNISTLDAGLRLIYNNPMSRFALSTEAIYRSVLTKNTIDPSWRLVLNAEYDLGNNQRLTFAFGRHFSGTVTKGGNVIAALNFLKGFGNKR